MITTIIRGHPVFFKNDKWYYYDTKKEIDPNRPCKKCGKPPTEEGFDSCIGYIEGATSACCGHGVEKQVILN